MAQAHIRPWLARELQHTVAPGHHPIHNTMTSTEQVELTPSRGDLLYGALHPWPWWAL